MNTKSPSRKLPLVGKIGFGVGDFGLNLIFQGTSLFLLYFYTDVLGIPPATAGIIYLLAMVWDAVTDPIVATLADRTAIKKGSYRDWLIYGSVPLAISYPLAFSSTPLPELISPVVWALLTHILLRSAYTIVGVPYTAMHARVTSNANERTVISAFRMYGGAFGGLTVIFATPILTASFGPEQQIMAYFVASAIAGGMTLAGVLFCIYAIKDDQSQPPVLEAKRESILGDIRSIGTMFTSNVPLIQVFSIIIVGTVCVGMFGKCTLYYFKYNVERPDLTIYALLLPAIMMLLLLPLWVAIANRTSKSIALTIGNSILFVGLVLFLVTPSSAPILVLIPIGIVAMGGSAGGVMFWSMLPDTVEYGEYKTGKRMEAKTFGFASFALKAAIGINALLVGVLLDFSGFVANEQQSDQTLTAIKFMMAGVPLIGVSIVLILLRYYSLDQARHKEIVEALASRRNAPNPVS